MKWLDDIVVCAMVKGSDDVAFLVHLLTRRGFEVHLADDGRKAEKMLDEIPPPKLVILDIMLPFVDGFELIKKIRDKDHDALAQYIDLKRPQLLTFIERRLGPGHGQVLDRARTRRVPMTRRL